MECDYLPKMCNDQATEKILLYDDLIAISFYNCRYQHVLINDLLSLQNSILILYENVS